MRFNQAKTSNKQITLSEKEFLEIVGQIAREVIKQYEAKQKAESSKHSVSAYKVDFAV